MKYKTTVYRTITQSIEVEVEAPWRPQTRPPKWARLAWVKMTAEDIAAEESDHDWRDEGWEFDDANFNFVPVENGE